MTWQPSHTQWSRSSAIHSTTQRRVQSVHFLAQNSAWSCHSIITTQLLTHVKSFTVLRITSTESVMDQRWYAWLYSSVFNRSLNNIRLKTSKITCCGELLQTVAAAWENKQSWLIWSWSNYNLKWKICTAYDRVTLWSRNALIAVEECSSDNCCGPQNTVSLHFNHWLDSSHHTYVSLEQFFTSTISLLL